MKEDFESSAGLLDVEDVGEELSIQPIEVRRLIARSVLPGTQLGGPDDWRITDDDVKSYIKRGAPDLRMPDLDKYSGWFDQLSKMHLQMFEKQLVAAFVDQRLTDSQLRARVEKTPNDLGVIVELKASPAIMAVIDGPIPKTGFDPPGFSLDRFGRFGYVWAADRLRTLAAGILSATPSMDSAGLRLYRNPDAYRATVDAARQKLVTQTFSTIEPRTVQVEYIYGGSLASKMTTYQVRYQLTVGTFATPAWLDGAVAVTF